MFLEGALCQVPLCKWGIFPVCKVCLHFPLCKRGNDAPRLKGKEQAAPLPAPTRAKICSTKRRAGGCVLPGSSPGWGPARLHGRQL